MRRDDRHLVELPALCMDLMVIESRNHHIIKTYEPFGSGCHEPDGDLSIFGVSALNAIGHNRGSANRCGCHRTNINKLSSNSLLWGERSNFDRSCLIWKLIKKDEI